jgi:hypothetical protein
MALPRYAAEASLYTTSRHYRRARSGPAADAAPTIIAQHDPCNRGGGGVGVGGGGGGRVCCEWDRNGRCRLWRPPGGQCP